MIMAFKISKIFRKIPHLYQNNLLRFTKRLFSNKEFQVSPFCEINTDCCFNINLVPLDVYKYPNCDKVIIETNDSLECTQNDDVIRITSKTANVDSSTVTCNIIAPIKASINVCNANNVNISNFNSELIQISATKNINIDKCQGEKIFLQTMDGDINSNTVLQAGSIFLKSEKGNIKLGRLQGLKLQIKTIMGNIETASTYCDESKFETESGNLNLNNAHKAVNVSIKTSGNLNIVGFDGTLKAQIKEGNINAQISRLHQDSNLTVSKQGIISLKLAELCQESTSLEILSKGCVIHDDVNMSIKKVDDKFHVLPKQNINNSKHKFVLDCKHSLVNIRSASWSDTFTFLKSKS